MVETKTVETEYGTAEIEVVECDSCGNTVGKEEAKEFTIADRKGWACEYCAENGPLSFPEKVRKFALPSDGNANTLFFIVSSPVLLPAMTFVGLFSPNNQFVEGYAMASITYIIYITLFVVITTKTLLPT
jgi:hypothetical protein